MCSHLGELNQQIILYHAFLHTFILKFSHADAEHEQVEGCFVFLSIPKGYYQTTNGEDNKGMSIISFNYSSACNVASSENIEW